MDPISRLGAWLVAGLEDTGRYVRFVAVAIAGVVRRPLRLRLLFKQMFFVGIQSLSIVVVTGLFTGMVFAVQANVGFAMFGATGLVGQIVLLAMTRELSPVLTALMVNGRVGSAMAAELGTMRVTEQIDALESMAVDPHQYLATPRIVAAVVMTPMLAMVFNVVGLAGTWVVAVRELGVNPGAFWTRIEWAVDPDDILGGLFKAAVFGFIYASVGCYKGFVTSGGAEGVGRATTTAVVVSGVSILIVDYFVSRILAPLSVG
jgi:phospholipid/cholesterol/gamma-HCH transport system permease protein